VKFKHYWGDYLTFLNAYLEILGVFECNRSEAMFKCEIRIVVVHKILALQG